jgi:hypothetical protein
MGNAKNQRNVNLEKIIVLNVMKMENYVKHVIMDIILIKMEVVHIPIIAKYLIKENALNVKKNMF